MIGNCGRLRRPWILFIIAQLTLVRPLRAANIDQSGSNVSPTNYHAATFNKERLTQSRPQIAAVLLKRIKIRGESLPQHAMKGKLHSDAMMAPETKKQAWPHFVKHETMKPMPIKIYLNKVAPRAHSAEVLRDSVILDNRLRNQMYPNQVSIKKPERVLPTVYLHQARPYTPLPANINRIDRTRKTAINQKAEEILRQEPRRHRCKAHFTRSEDAKRKHCQKKKFQNVAKDDSESAASFFYNKHEPERVMPTINKDVKKARLDKYYYVKSNPLEGLAEGKHLTQYEKTATKLFSGGVQRLPTVAYSEDDVKPKTKVVDFQQILMNKDGGNVSAVGLNPIKKRKKKCRFKKSKLVLEDRYPTDHLKIKKLKDDKLIGKDDVIKEDHNVNNAELVNRGNFVEKLMAKNKIPKLTYNGTTMVPKKLDPNRSVFATKYLTPDLYQSRYRLL